MTPDELTEYICVGICQPGPNGLCRGCGRPFWTATASAPHGPAAEPEKPRTATREN